MEFTVLEESKTKLVFELKGEDHTFCNFLKKELQNDEAVKVSTYAMTHPSIGIPRLILETSGKTPREALSDAAKRLNKGIEAFRKSAEKEIA